MAGLVSPALDRAFARWCLTVEVRRGRLLEAGLQDGHHHADLTVGGASGGPAGCHASRLAAASHSSRPLIGMP